jgi:NAD(P)-dependent dehydrogenase (short-subunit alcohol dehydrogenase family)
MRLLAKCCSAPQIVPYPMRFRQMRRAVQKIESLVPYSKGKVEVLPLDLSSLDSVRQMASMFGSRKLDVLVNNAGYGGGGPGGITSDKLEWYFQVILQHQTLLSATHLESPCRVLPLLVRNAPTGHVPKMRGMCHTACGLR